MTRSTLWPLTAATATGAAAMYLFDPRLGHRRRRAVRQRSAALVRRSLRRSLHAEQRLQSRAYGLAKKAAHRREEWKDYDDATLAHKVETMLGHDWRAPKGHFNVDACDGIVTLRGLLDDQQTIDHIVKRVREIQGVRGVVNLLHLPGTVPPNLDANGRREPVLAGKRWQPHTG
jgi:BON domain-containing protein